MTPCPKCGEVPLTCDGCKQVIDAPPTIAELQVAVAAFSERFDGRFWRILNEPLSDDVYISRQEAQKWQAEILALVKATRVEVKA